MITENELLALLSDLESFRVERTTATKDTQKFCEAICAFANDMHASGRPGFLLVGADDKTGAPCGLQATDELLRVLSGLTADGNILPPPAVTVYSIALSSGAGDIVVAEVQPSDLPPVRHKGMIWIRRGPRKGIANESEERLLIERRTAAARTFDARPCAGSTLSDLSLDLFKNTYLPLVVDAEIIAQNHRPIEQQLASLRFFDLARNQPTNAGILLFAKDVLSWFPNAYIQYVKYDGADMGVPVASEKRFQGDLLSVLRDLAAFVGLITTQRPMRVDVLMEKPVFDFPGEAVRELLMNAVLHRSYESPSPVRFLHFSDRLEIQSPGPLYGGVTLENISRFTSYRNPVLAEAMKTLGAVNRFGRGISRAQSVLEKNGSPPAVFFSEAFFMATIHTRK
jgi:ATP-dependent DNA helicase RecG